MEGMIVAEVLMSSSRRIYTPDLGNVIKAKDNSVDTREMMMTKMNIRSDQEQEAYWVECPMTLRADVEAYKGKGRELEGEAGTLGNLHKEESKLARMVQLLS
jgi:hypothetical protein